MVSFTTREMEIIRCNGDFTTAEALAAHLHIGNSTVKHYFSALFDKTGCDNRLDLLVWSIRKGYVVIPVEEL